jgi:hypothetical protein|tara:strand:- start:498 stop:659 length:162 start_codon:yes stop_codon:yes gene_type:complete
MMTKQAIKEIVLKKLNMISLLVNICCEVIAKWLKTAMLPISIEMNGLFWVFLK